MKKRSEAELEILINYLSTELEKATIEYEELTQKSTSILERLPIRVKNALGHKGVITDQLLKKFLIGNCKQDVGIFYQEAENPIDRLMSLRNVGEKTVNDTVIILKQEGLI